jgi:hypothetical protein
MPSDAECLLYGANSMFNAQRLLLGPIFKKAELKYLCVPCDFYKKQRLVLFRKALVDV